MKKTICVLLLLLCQMPIMAQGDSIIIADNTQTESNQPNNKEADYLFNYEEVVPTTLPQSTLWINLKKWVSSTFDNYKYVVDLEDKETGMMIVKWTTEPRHSLGSRYLAVTYGGTFQIDIREKKYRIKVYNAFAKAEIDNDEDLDIFPDLIRLIRKNERKIRKINLKLNSYEKWPLNTNYIMVMESDDEVGIDLRMMRSDYKECCASLLDNLKKSICIVDDF